MKLSFLNKKKAEHSIHQVTDLIKKFRKDPSLKKKVVDKFSKVRELMGDKN